MSLKKLVMRRTCLSIVSFSDRMQLRIDIDGVFEFCWVLLLDDNIWCTYVNDSRFVKHL